MAPLFEKTSIKAWFNEKNDIINKKDKNEKMKSDELRLLIQNITEHPTKKNLLDLLIFFKNRLRAKYMREDLLKSILFALNNSIVENESVYNSMILHKNVIRGIGEEKLWQMYCTTSLTKGLEFDTVAILNVHRFDSPKHLYVALTRASKRLILFTNQKVLKLQ